MKLQSLRNEVEMGYLLTFSRDWIYENAFLEKVKKFTSGVERVDVICICNSATNIVQLSKRKLDTLVQ